MRRTKKRSTRKVLQKQSQKADRGNGQSSEQNAPQASIRNRKTPLAAKSTSILKRMPPEIRREILKYLLINPDLGTASCIHRDEGWGSKVKYELQPAILRVCKQLHIEGVKILYGENQFFIECTMSTCDHLLHRCALTRFQEHQRHDFDLSSELAKDRLRAVPSLKRIKNWKVVIAPMRSGMRTNIMNFCRSICHNGLRSMVIAIAPWGDLWFRDLMLGGPGGSAEAIRVTAEKLHEVLSPLEILRCTGKFVIRGADPEEMPDFLFEGDKQTWRYLSWLVGDRRRIIAPCRRVSLPDTTYLPHLIELVRGDSEVEPFHEIFYTFSNYVQAFERIDEFRDHMTVDYPHPSSHLLENPFRLTHPVDSALLKALCMQTNDKAEAQNILELKVLRSSAIKFLERQYQRIQQAANDLVRFVKDQKTYSGLLDPIQLPPSDSCHGAQSEGLVLLKNYAESLDRELTTATKIAICKLNGRYEKRFELLPREIAIAKCTHAYRGGEVQEFVENFKRAIDDMDTQCFAIRDARKRLFEWNLKGPGYTAEIDVEPLRCDEKIIWDKFEPDMDVKEAEILGRGGCRSCRKSLRVESYREDLV
ncbi:hypothetical protein BOTCAL_0244g00060 [Botryotinia calthae]|uniref:F-box domain-containing protein n=1 Tax=Botryotinia calthae TaxID=38488 RepID=A0A4Y8CXQ3_9HELO|nr:hypothetical protein BOTCAL_0244g00060 [Botryotinia calthae]